MNSIQALVYEAYYDRKKSKYLVGQILANDLGMKELINQFLSENKRWCQRTSHCLLIVAKNYELQLKPFYNDLIDFYGRGHTTYKRNLLRIFHKLDLDDNVSGRVFDICMEEFTNFKQEKAIRIYACLLMTKVALKHKELTDELILLLNEYVGKSDRTLERVVSKSIAKLSISSASL